MSRFSIENLKKSIIERKIKNQYYLTPAILGKIIICFLAINSKEKFFTSKDIANILIDNFELLPEEIKNAIHIQHQINGAYIYEMPAIIDGILLSGIAAYLEPEYKQLCIKINIYEVISIFENYKQQFPEIVEWLQNNTENIWQKK